MILFSRVRGAFRKITSREWALLSLETVGILAGILIAFELNEWAARRKETAKHRQLMERLFEEAENDVVFLRDTRNAIRQMVATEIEFAKRLNKGECPAESLWRATATVNMYPAFRAPRAVYQELMGAGGLSSIDDVRVRNALTNFNTGLEWVVSQNDYFRMIRREPIPDEDPRIQVRYDPALDEEKTTATYDRQALCQDHGFRNRMAFAVRNHRAVLDWHDTVTEDAIWMCGVLGESLGRRCSPAYGGPLVGDDLKLLNEAIAKYRQAER
ncbi:MAG TPA: hypothetical protein VNJ05_09130 [Sphingomicrobium sp.]|nr:hypothetical protein [Sphingomicrobium sp.]